MPDTQRADYGGGRRDFPRDKSIVMLRVPRSTASLDRRRKLEPMPDNVNADQEVNAFHLHGAEGHHRARKVLDCMELAICFKAGYWNDNSATRRARSKKRVSDAEWGVTRSSEPRVQRRSKRCKHVEPGPNPVIVCRRRLKRRPVTSGEDLCR